MACTKIGGPVVSVALQIASNAGYVSSAALKRTLPAINKSTAAHTMRLLADGALLEHTGALDGRAPCYSITSAGREYLDGVYQPKRPKKPAPASWQILQKTWR